MLKSYQKTAAIVCAAALLAACVSGCKKESPSDSSDIKNSSQSQGALSGGTSGWAQESGASSTNASGGQTPRPGSSGGGTITSDGNPSTVTNSVGLSASVKSNYVNAKQYGAKGDAKTDDAAAIQAAIDAAAKKGNSVYLPSGIYRVAKGIVLPIGVGIVGDSPAIKGSWKAIKALSGVPASQSAGGGFLSSSNFSGTFLLVDHGKGNVNAAPAIRIQGNTAVMNLGFVYKDQAPVSGAVSEYPPAIGMLSTKQYQGVRDGVAIENIVFANAYAGIAVAQGADLKNYYVGDDESKISTGRLRIHNIKGSVLWRGILIKGILDTVDIQDISLGYSNYVPAYMKYRHTHAVDIELAREDGCNIKNMLSFGASYGIKATPAYSGSASLRASGLNISAQIPLCVVTGMYKVTGSTLTTMNFGGFCENDDFVGLRVSQDMNCVHQPTYLFDNITVKNSVLSSSVSNIGMDIALGKSGNVSVSNSKLINASPSGSYPLVTLSNNDSSAVSCFFFQTSLTSSSGSLASIKKCSAGSLQFNQCTVSDTLYNAISSNRNIWFLNSETSGGKALNIH